MAKVKPNTEKPIHFQHVTLNVWRPGQEIMPCALDDPRATDFYMNAKGEKYAACRPITNIFAVDIRHAHRVKGRCLELLHTETWSQPLGEAPKVPANSLFIAKAFELAETANN